jgi:hypothetical protein
LRWAYELGVEFRQPWLAGIVEDKDGVDHFIYEAAQPLVDLVGIKRLQEDTVITRVWACRKLITAALHRNDQAVALP